MLPVSFKVKDLIAEVKSRPGIWDSRTTEYNDRLLKREAWEDVCAALDPNFYTMTPGEQSNIVANMQKKWKSIRDAFLREVKRMNSRVETGVKVSKTYIYYKSLLFLKSVYATPPIKNSKEDEDIKRYDPEDSNCAYDQNENDESDRDSSTTGETDDKNVNPTKRKAEESILNMIADHLKNKRARVKHDDPDRQFLLSLLPDLKSIKDSKKFDVKYEIMNVIKKFKD